MNEAETRAELIDPKLSQKGWSIVEESKVSREYHITKGKIRTKQPREKPLIADYILTYKGKKLAVIEAKRRDEGATIGVAQAKLYAQKMHIQFSYSTNGDEIYQINMKTGEEKYVTNFPTPQELWEMTFPVKKIRTKQQKQVEYYKEKFNSIPLSGNYEPRFYQEIAITKALDAVAEHKQKILLTLATGTGKTAIAFQIAWKLFQSKWNVQRDEKRRPRILFLADRNILADQAFNAFSAFPEDALVRITPKEIKKRNKVPTNGSIFFTIFQSFMSGEDEKPYFGQYPQDFFDLIIVDECHRGGANDESQWRFILEHFDSAVQIGLTATPKRKNNVDTYKYFGKPVYQYSLKEGIQDGFLTPFRVRRINTTLDTYSYSQKDIIVQGEVEHGKIYQIPNFNRDIQIEQRERKLVEIFMNEINEQEKTLVFCANQEHALLIRDLINQCKKNSHVNYCVRVTADDGELGEQFLREFQQNDKSLPTILTTSHKLSTGVDAKNIRNIILLRPITSMIEFKQIIGRGTRLYEGKDFFTIYDFVDAHHNFNDPTWDGEPLDEISLHEEENKKKIQKKILDTNSGAEEEFNEYQKKQIIKIKLGEGAVREFQHMSTTLFFDKEGKPISAEEFIKNLYGDLPSFFKSEDELRELWSKPNTRKQLLEKLSEEGYDLEKLKGLQKIVQAQNSDLFDVLEYIAFNIEPITRRKRVEKIKPFILDTLTQKQQEFIEFILSKYIDKGFEELNEEKLPDLLKIKYHSYNDAVRILGDVNKIRETFISFQEQLYSKL